MASHRRDFNQSHTAGFNGYKPDVSKDVLESAAKDNRFDVPARAKGIDRKALSISL